MKLTGCITTYNHRENVLETIESILKATEKLEFLLYLSDNHSPNGGGDFLEEYYKDNERVVVLKNKENKGFGYGHNQVLNKIDSEYHFILNPDILVTEDAFLKIIDFLEENEDIGMLCPKILNVDHSEQFLPLSIPKFRYLVSRYLSIFSKWEDEYLKKNERNASVLDIECCTGCFMAIRTDLFRKLNGFDKRFFMYFEDADLTRRVNEISRVVMYRDVEIVHKWERASSKSVKYFKIIVESLFKYLWKWRKSK